LYKFIIGKRARISYLISRTLFRSRKRPSYPAVVLILDLFVNFRDVRVFDWFRDYNCGFTYSFTIYFGCNLMSLRPVAITCAHALRACTTAELSFHIFSYILHCFYFYSYFIYVIICNNLFSLILKLIFFIYIFRYIQ